MINYLKAYLHDKFGFHFFGNWQVNRRKSYNGITRYGRQYKETYKEKDCLFCNKKVTHKTITKS